MSLTLGQIRSAVQGNTGYSGRDTDFNRWINDGLKRIAKRYDFRALRDSSSTSMTASTATYTLPTDYKSFYTFRIKSDSGYVVVEKTEEEFDQEYPYAENDAEGVPTYFIKRTTTTFQLYPTPDDAYDYVMRFNKYPPTLSGDSTYHPFESFCDDLVIAAASLEAYVSFSESEDSGNWGTMFEIKLKESIQAEEQRPTHFPRLGRYEGVGNVLPSNYWARPDYGRK